MAGQNRVLGHGRALAIIRIVYMTRARFRLSHVAHELSIVINT